MYNLKLTLKLLHQTVLRNNTKIVILFSVLFGVSNFSGFFIFNQISVALIASLLLLIFCTYRIMVTGILSKKTTKKALWLLIILVFNFQIATSGGVEPQLWLARSFWLLISAQLLLMDLKREDLEKILLYVSISRLFYILLAVFTNNFSGRATVLLNSPIYSPVLLYLLYYCGEYNLNIAGIVVILILSFTGSRFLIISAILVLFMTIFKSGKGYWKFLLLFSCLTPLLITFKGNFERFSSFSEIESDFSYIGKIAEIEILLDFFKSSPFLGKGFGFEYNNGVDVENFTYSHNLIAALLGFSGIIGTVSVLYFFVKPLIYSNYRSLFFGVIMFCLSTTTFTLPENALLLILGFKCRDI